MLGFLSEEKCPNCNKYTLKADVNKERIESALKEAPIFKDEKVIRKLKQLD